MKILARTQEEPSSLKKFQLVFANISMQQVIAYTDSCEVNSLKQGKIKNGVVVKPIVSSMFISRCQGDCIDIQSHVDNSTGDNFKYIMMYQCHLTKFYYEITTFVKLYQSH